MLGLIAAWVVSIPFRDPDPTSNHLIDPKHVDTLLDKVEAKIDASLDKAEAQPEKRSWLMQKAYEYDVRHGFIKPDDEVLDSSP